MKMIPSITDRSRIVLLDGAMGTYLLKTYNLSLNSDSDFRPPTPPPPPLPSTSLPTTTSSQLASTSSSSSSKNHSTHLSTVDSYPTHHDETLSKACHPQSLEGCMDILNLTRPSYIIDTHKSYIASGSRVLHTNTFSSSRIGLERWGCLGTDEWVRNINGRAVQLAKIAVEQALQNKSDTFGGEETEVRQVLLAGSVGPAHLTAYMPSPQNAASSETTTSSEKTPSTPNTSNAVEFEAMVRSYLAQIQCLVESGVDLLIFETFYCLSNSMAAWEAVCRYFNQHAKDDNTRSESNGYCGVKVVFSFTVTAEGVLPVPVANHFASSTASETEKATSAATYYRVEDALKLLMESYHAKHTAEPPLPVPSRPPSWLAAVGINCSFGLQGLQPALQKLIPHLKQWGVPGLYCAPSAGLPSETDNKVKSKTTHLQQDEIEKVKRENYVLDLARIVTELMEFEREFDSGKRGCFEYNDDEKTLVSTPLRFWIGGCCGTTPAHIQLLRKGLFGDDVI
jgi:methionine synthase I (cobalamin-dependent)